MRIIFLLFSLLLVALQGFCAEWTVNGVSYSQIGKSRYAKVTKISPWMTHMVGNVNVSILPEVFIKGEKCVVIDIAPKSCQNNIQIHSLVLPETIGEIGYEAFKDCSNLESVVVPDQCEVQLKDPYFSKGGGEKGPFSGCTSLKSVTTKEGTVPACLPLLARNTTDVPAFNGVKMPDAVVADSPKVVAESHKEEKTDIEEPEFDNPFTEFRENLEEQNEDVSKEKKESGKERIEAFVSGTMGLLGLDINGKKKKDSDKENSDTIPGEKGKFVVKKDKSSEKKRKNRADENTDYASAPAQESVKKLPPIGKPIEGVYTGEGYLYDGSVEIERYDKIKLILKTIDRHTMGVNVVESNGSAFFSEDIPYIVNRPDENGIYNLENKEVSIARIAIKGDKSAEFIHPKVKIEGDLYSLKIKVNSGSFKAAEDSSVGDSEEGPGDDEDDIFGAKDLEVKYYTTKAGDTLTSVAKQFGVTAEKLKKDNIDYLPATQTLTGKLKVGTELMIMVKKDKKK